MRSGTQAIQGCTGGRNNYQEETIPRWNSWSRCVFLFEARSLWIDDSKRFYCSGGDTSSQEESHTRM